MSIKGGSYQRFRRAVDAGNPMLVTGAAAELPRLSLADALAVTLVLSAATDGRFDRAAARWTARLSLETAGVSLADGALAGAALQQLAAGHREAGARALAALLARLGLRDCERELADWLRRRPPEAWAGAPPPEGKAGAPPPEGQAGAPPPEG